MKLDSPIYELLNSSTRTVQNIATPENADLALNKIAQIAYANVYVIAMEMMKHFVVPFCIEYDYEFVVKPEHESFHLKPCSDKTAPKEQLEALFEVINQDTCLAKAPKLFMLMSSFSMHYKGDATTSDGEKVRILGFKRFSEHKCPYGWLGGYEIDYGNSAWTGTLRPDELTFN